MGASAGPDAARSWLRVLVPRTSEPIAPEFYRFIAKVRIGFILILLVLNAMTTLSLDDLGLRHDVWYRIQIPNTIALLSSLGFSVAIASGRLGLDGMRRATYACVVFEMISALLNTWMIGSVTSHMVLAAVLIVTLYRGLFDFRTGAIAFGMMFVGTWVIVIGEVTGAWPAQPASASGMLDSAYQTPRRELISAAFLTAVLCLSYISISWMVARLRHGERSIQLLRESLAASEAGDLGRHTGRTLKDTYVLGALIGIGGMGEVYRSRHRRTRRPVAIKLLHAHLAQDPVLLARFRREAEIAGTVGGAHVVEVIDVDLDDGQPFIVLELLDGETIRDRVDRAGPLSVAVAADVFAQLGVGLGAAHKAGVVHRDLKPENIVLLHRGGTVKILDFGISKIRGAGTALTADAAVLGTPDFMSPEQALGRGEEVDARTDVFAAGGVLYFALTGQRPFAATSIPALLRTICDEAPVPLARLRPDLGEVAEEVAAVIAIAMAKPAAQRYRSVAELAADLALAVAGTLPAETRARAAAVDGGRPSTRSIGDHTVVATDDTLTATPA